MTVQARVHLAAKELKEFLERHEYFIHNIVEIIVKIMHEHIQLNFVREMFKIFQNYPWSTVNWIWNSARYELQRMHLIKWRWQSTNDKMIQVVGKMHLLKKNPDKLLLFLQWNTSRFV